MLKFILLLVMSVNAVPNIGTNQANSEVSKQRSESQTEVMGKTNRPDEEMTGTSHGIQENGRVDQSSGMKNNIGTGYGHGKRHGPKNIIETHSFVNFWSERDNFGRKSPREFQDTVSAYQFEFFGRSVIDEEDNEFPEGSGTGMRPPQNCTDCNDHGPAIAENSTTQRPIQNMDEGAQFIRDEGNKTSPHATNGRRRFHSRNTHHKRSLDPEDSGDSESSEDSGDSGNSTESAQKPPVQEEEQEPTGMHTNDDIMDLLSSDSESPAGMRGERSISGSEDDEDPERRLFGFGYPIKYPYFFPYFHGR